MSSFGRVEYQNIFISLIWVRVVFALNAGESAAICFFDVFETAEIKIGIDVCIIFGLSGIGHANKIGSEVVAS